MDRLQRPFIIPIFIPHAGCPHRCVFCNQTAITRSPEAGPSARQVQETVDQHLAFPRRPGRTVEIAFYGGNFLGLDPPAIGALLSAAHGYVQDGRVQAIRFSTRPDTVTDRLLDLIEGFAVRTVEVGAQSMNDAVLEKSRRGHNAEHTRKAAARLRERGLGIGIQMMVGLPGQSREDAVETGRQIVDLSPDFVRIYPLVVLAGSPLARGYAAGKYRPLPLPEAVSLVCDLYSLFKAQGIAVARMGIQGSELLEQGGDILAGPYHPAFGHLVHAKRFLALAEKALQDRSDPTQTRVALKVHPRSLSRLRGQHNENIRLLEKRFGLARLKVSTDAQLPEDCVKVQVPPLRPGG